MLDTSETEKLKLGGLAQTDWVTDNAYFSKTGGDSLQDRLTKSVHKECEKKDTYSGSSTRYRHNLSVLTFYDIDSSKNIMT